MNNSGPWSSLGPRVSLSAPGSDLGRLLLDEMPQGLAPIVVHRLLPTVRALAGGQVTYSGLAARLAASPDTLHRAYLGTGLL